MRIDLYPKVGPSWARRARQGTERVPDPFPSDGRRAWWSGGHGIGPERGEGWVARHGGDRSHDVAGTGSDWVMLWQRPCSSHTARLLRAALFSLLEF